MVYKIAVADVTKMSINGTLQLPTDFDKDGYKQATLTGPIAMFGSDLFAFMDSAKYPTSSPFHQQSFVQVDSSSLRLKKRTNLTDLGIQGLPAAAVLDLPRDTMYLLTNFGTQNSEGWVYQISLEDPSNAKVITSVQINGTTPISASFTDHSNKELLVMCQGAPNYLSAGVGSLVRLEAASLAVLKQQTQTVALCPPVAMSSTATQTSAFVGSYWAIPIPPALSQSKSHMKEPRSIASPLFPPEMFASHQSLLQVDLDHLDVTKNISLYDMDLGNNTDLFWADGSSTLLYSAKDTAQPTALVGGRLMTSQTPAVISIDLAQRKLLQHLELGSIVNCATNFKLSQILIHPAKPILFLVLSAFPQQGMILAVSQSDFSILGSLKLPVH